MIYDALAVGYKLGLAALSSLILLQGTNAMRRTICTVFAVMLAAWFLADLWPGLKYAAAMIGIDALACTIITWHPAGKWQAVVGLSYVLQIGVHIGRIFSGDNADIYRYFWGLSLLAILQLLLIGGWWLHGRMGRNPDWSDSRSNLPRSSRQGME